MASNFHSTTLQAVFEDLEGSGTGPRTINKNYFRDISTFGACTGGPAGWGFLASRSMHAPRLARTRVRPPPACAPARTRLHLQKSIDTSASMLAHTHTRTHAPTPTHKSICLVSRASLSSLLGLIPKPYTLLALDTPPRTFLLLHLWLPQRRWRTSRLLSKKNWSRTRG